MFYMLAQISFWLHCYPELYLLKAKKVSVPIETRWCGAEREGIRERDPKEIEDAIVARFVGLECVVSGVSP